MIPTLLWRCPLCQINDALRHKAHWFRNDAVECQACGTAWDVQRVIGQGYRLTVIRGEPSAIGKAQWLADWYDLMKAGVGLAPHPPVDAALGPGEECYLQSRTAELFVEEDSPLLGAWMEEEAPREVEGDRLLSFMKRGAIGQLALTSERFIWMSRDRRLTFQLQRVNAAYAQGKRFFVLIYGQRLYKLRFRQESILKWLTYTALVAKHNERMVDHRIALSNY